MPETRTAVVVATRDRAGELLATLDRLTALPEQPPVVVVDNGSRDGTPQLVAERHPTVRVVAVGRNLGAAARTVGARLVGTRYVAFSDDDSWWAPAALSRAAEVLDRCPRLGLLAARVVVGHVQRLDPTCALMAASPLPPDPELPGPPVLGFIACGAVVRRDAYLAVGGFDAHLMVGGEEELLALDLAAAGWALAYVDEVVAHHHPSPSRNPAERRRRLARNALWVRWLRRPLPVAVRATAAALRAAGNDQDTRAGLLDAVRGGAWVLRGRAVVPARVERAMRSLER